MRGKSDIGELRFVLAEPLQVGKAKSVLVRMKAVQLQAMWP